MQSYYFNTALTTYFNFKDTHKGKKCYILDMQTPARILVDNKMHFEKWRRKKAEI